MRISVCVMKIIDAIKKIGYISWSADCNDFTDYSKRYLRKGGLIKRNVLLTEKYCVFQ